MSEHLSDNALHLKDLVITGFRGIRSLSISRLGRVTLLAGKNGVGKTTVLEAVRVFAGRGRESVLSGLLEARDEVEGPENADDRMMMPDFAALFYGRNPDGSFISVGPSDASEQVRVEEGELPEEQSTLFERLAPESSLDGPLRSLRAVFRGAGRYFPVVGSIGKRDAGVRYTRGSHRTAQFLRRAFDEGKYPEAITCLSLGPGAWCGIAILLGTGTRSP